jgi:hypothetical protein
MNRTATTPIAHSTQATRGGLFVLAALVTALLLSSLSTIANRQVDEVIMAQDAAVAAQLVANVSKSRSGV